VVATNNALHFVNKSEIQADVITDEDEWKVLMFLLFVLDVFIELESSRGSSDSY
jgi:hypothetical protein